MKTACANASTRTRLPFSPCSRIQNAHENAVCCLVIHHIRWHEHPFGMVRAKRSEMARAFCRKELWRLPCDQTRRGLSLCDQLAQMYSCGGDRRAVLRHCPDIGASTERCPPERGVAALVRARLQLEGSASYAAEAARISQRGPSTAYELAMLPPVSTGKC
jgi:hypothetical protein